MVVAPPALVAAARMLQPAPPSSLLQTVRPQPSPPLPPPSSSSSSSAPFFSYSSNEKALSGLRAQRKSASLPSPLRSAYGQWKNAFLLVVQCADTNGFCSRSLSGQDNVGAVVNQGSQHDFVVEDEAGSVLADAGNNLGILTADITTRTDEYASSDAGNDLGIVTAKITSRTDEFFSSEKDGDPDCPSEGFYSIVEAVDAIRQGKLVIVVDDEERENEGDLIMAGSLVTPESMAFVVKHGTGIVCAAMKGEDLDRLKLPLMVEDKENEEALRTAFTVTVDVRAGTTTGVSASDRAKTIQALACPDSKPEHFRKPGHIFPLRYREGGVLKRAGHTEAAVDLTRMAGLSPIGVLCEIVDEDDGSMARLPKLRAFAQKHSLPLISITDLVRYQRKREKLVERTAVARMPTKWGTFLVYGYRSKLDGIEHVAMVKGDIGNGLDVLVRVHSECLTGDIFGSARCDCGNQLALAMQNIEKAGRGVLVYLRGHEGRGIGLGHKLRAYNLQDEGRDTVEANVELGLPVDSREYGIGAQILRDVGVQTMKLMTNNPSKYMGLRGYGLAVTSRIPVLSPITLENQRYLETKRSKMGHIYGSDLPGSIVGFRQSGTSSSKMDPLS